MHWAARPTSHRTWRPPGRRDARGRGRCDAAGTRLRTMLEALAWRSAPSRSSGRPREDSRSGAGQQIVRFDEEEDGDLDGRRCQACSQR